MVAAMDREHSAECAAGNAPAHDIDKAFATLQARAALAGVSLSRTKDDQGAPGFIASKWALTKQLSTIGEVESLLDRIGGPRES